MSERTQQLKRNKNLFLVLQLFLMLGVVCFLMCAMVNTLQLNAHEQILSDKYETIVTTLGISVALTTAMLIVIGHKIRNTIWMGSLLLASYLYGNTGLWIVFAIWLVDEYIIYPLYKSSKAKLIANKEIDKRI